MYCNNVSFTQNSTKNFQFLINVKCLDVYFFILNHLDSFKYDYFVTFSNWDVFKKKNICHNKKIFILKYLSAVWIYCNENYEI